MDQVKRVALSWGRKKIARDFSNTGAVPADIVLVSFFKHDLQFVG